MSGCVCFFFSSRRRHTRSLRDWSSDVCSSDLLLVVATETPQGLLALPQYPAVLRDARTTAARLLGLTWGDRKSTRLNSSHVEISYAVFCLKKKKYTKQLITATHNHTDHCTDIL